MKVLFIDDEKHIRQANKQTLELAELEVICEECAERGLEILTSEWPGIVVCDIRHSYLLKMPLSRQRTN